MNDNPGPGTYVNEYTKVVKTYKDQNSNSFSTQIPRFCPTAPGSSAYQPPTYITNPGPGTHLKTIYQTGKIGSVDHSKGKYFEKRHRKPKVVATARGASIPSKKVSSNSYAGNGFDTVGPALYNPN